MRPEQISSLFPPKKNRATAQMTGLPENIPARRRIFTEAQIAEYDAEAERQAHEILLAHSKAINPAEPKKEEATVPEVEETDEEPLMCYFNYPFNF